MSHLPEQTRVPSGQGGRGSLKAALDFHPHAPPLADEVCDQPIESVQADCLPEGVSTVCANEGCVGRGAHGRSAAEAVQREGGGVSWQQRTPMVEDRNAFLLPPQMGLQEAKSAMGSLVVNAPP